MARQLQPCGTRAAYVRHLYRGETTCEACRAANNAYRAWLKSPEFEPVPKRRRPHGTLAAMRRHQRAGEKPCLACYDAGRAYQKAWRDARKAAA